MSVIYLVRHGRQSSSLCNVNVGLSEAGRKEARLTGERLKQYGIDALYSSDLLRALETAEIIRETMQFPDPVQIRPALREYNCGDMEGLTIEEQKAQYGWFLQRREEFVDVPYPGGESGAEVYARFYPELVKIAKSGARRIAVVTHGGAMRAVLAGIFLKDFDRKLLFGRGLENCGITELLYREEDGQFYLERFNDYAHLEGHPELLRAAWSRTDAG